MVCVLVRHFVPLVNRDEIKIILLASCANELSVIFNVPRVACKRLVKKKEKKSYQ